MSNASQKCFPVQTLLLYKVGFSNVYFRCAVQPLYTDIRYNDKIRYNDNLNGMFD